MSEGLVAIATLAAAWIGWQGIRFVVILLQVLRLRIEPPLPDADDAAAVPELSADQQALLDELARLGFELVRLSSVQRPGHTLPLAFLRHTGEPAFAGVSFAANVFGGYPVSFYGFGADGRVLATPNRTDWQQPLLMHGFDVHDPYADSLQAQWEAHRCRPGTPLAVEPLQALERVRALLNATVVHGRQAGHVVRRDGAWHPSLLTALRVTQQVLRVRKRLARPLRSVVTEGGHAAAFLARCCEQAEIEREHRASRPSLKAAVLVLSLAASLLAWGIAFDAVFALALVAVLLVHEAGHALAMRAFGWRDLSMFFVPFVGAMVSGRAAHEPAAWKQMLVLAAGPLPGLAAGTAALLWLPTAAASGAAWVIEWGAPLTTLALLAIAVNLFNLLPIVPLDGGRLLELALFSRWPRLRFGFAAGSVLALAAAAFVLRDGLLAAIALLLAVGLPLQWRSSLLALDRTPAPAGLPVLARLCHQVRTRHARLGLPAQLALVQLARQQARVVPPRLAESFVALLLLAGVWGTAASALWPMWAGPGTSRAAAAPDTRSDAQRRFDAAWERYEAHIDERPAGSSAPNEDLRALQQGLAALDPADPRHVDLQLLQADDLDAPQRQRIVDALLAAGRDGHFRRLDDVLRSTLYDIDSATREQPPEQRAAALRDAIVWAERVRPAALAPTMDLRLRLAEALDRQGDAAAAEAMLSALAQRAETADDCRCEQRRVVRAQAWFALAHGQPARAIALLEASPFAPELAQRQGTLLADHAWALLLAGRLDEGLLQMRAAVRPKSPWPWGSHGAGAPLSDMGTLGPLELGHVLALAGREDEARAVVRESGRWQCHAAARGRLAALYHEPWQAERARRMEEAAPRLCPAPKT